MQDPVSGFTYPEEWVLLCRDEQSRLLVSKGLAVLASDGTVRKRGFTTGSTAAAAAKAAADAANAKANDALRIADEANRRSMDTESKIDRMFKKAMHK